MTDDDPARRLTVSVPADVAAYLGAQRNASAVVARAVREEMLGWQTWEAQLAGDGVVPRAEGVEHWRQLFRAHAVDEVRDVLREGGEARAA